MILPKEIESTVSLFTLPWYEKLALTVGFLDPPPPPVTLKWLFYLDVLTLCHSWHYNNRASTILNLQVVTLCLIHGIRLWLGTSSLDSHSAFSLLSTSYQLSMNTGKIEWLLACAFVLLWSQWARPRFEPRISRCESCWPLYHWAISFFCVKNSFINDFSYTESQQMPPPPKKKRLCDVIY